MELNFTLAIEVIGLVVTFAWWRSTMRKAAATKRQHMLRQKARS